MILAIETDDHSSCPYSSFRPKNEWNITRRLKTCWSILNAAVRAPAIPLGFRASFRWKVEYAAHIPFAPPIRWVKIAGATVAAAGLAFGAIAGYRLYERRMFVEMSQPLVKNSSLRVANAMRYAIEPSGITYGEMFSKLNDNLSESDKNILEIQSRASASRRR